MEEQIVTFETAHLAKEKGFGLGNDYIYLYTFYNSETKELTTEPSTYKRNKSSSPHGQLQMSSVEVGVSRGMDNSSKEYTLVPTQSLLQKWLRDKDIHVWCKFVEDGYEYYIGVEQSEGWYTSYEEALEEGLKQALKLIK